MSNTFIDQIESQRVRTNSVLVAGIDPDLTTIPEAFHSTSTDRSLYISQTITHFYCASLERIASSICAVKPNLAFFEQYGMAGLTAFNEILRCARMLNIPIIADAKRGDIGSTAKAYSSAFLGRVEIHGTSEPVFDVDALTVNPFLGLDTLDPFLSDCAAYGKGIFVLVKTSNPGSAFIQGLHSHSSDLSVSQQLADWIQSKSPLLTGSSGLSALGAVVGATYPTELAELRTRMPTSLLLIPGFGAQGGTANDIAAAFLPGGRGALINASRGIFSSFSSKTISTSDALHEIERSVTKFNQQLKAVTQR